MLSRVCSAAVNGIEDYPVEVEVNVGYGDTLVVMIATIHPQTAVGVPLQQYPNWWRRPLSGHPTTSLSGGFRLTLWDSQFVKTMDS
jgi:hypothetical protein